MSLRSDVKKLFPLMVLAVVAVFAAVWQKSAASAGTDVRLDDAAGPVARMDSTPNVKLRPAKVLGGKDLFGRILDLAVVGPWIVVVDPLNTSKLCVLDRITGDVVGAAGQEGQGPMEMQYPYSIDAFDGPSPKVWVYDFELGRFSSFDLGPQGPKPGRTVRIQASLAQPVWTAGNEVLSNGLFPAEVLRHYRVDGATARLDRIAAKSPFADVGPEAGIHVNRTTLALSPERNRIALGFHLSSRIHFYDSSGRLLKSLGGPRPVTPRYRVLWDPRNKVKRVVPAPETRFGYLDMAASDDFVFALFSGRSQRQYEDRAAMANEVHVFSWDGDLVAILTLTQEINRLTVDRSDGTLFGSREMPFPAVVQFEPIPLKGLGAHPGAPS